MVFGLEMEPEENAARWAAGLANVDGRAVLDGEACPEDFTAFGQALCSHEDTPILWNAIDDLSMDDVAATCVRQSYQTPVTMVVVDYLQLLRIDETAERHDLALAKITRKAKLLSKRLGCPVVLLSQLNRKCEERGDKRPILSDLRDGGSIEQDANVVVFLYRDEVYNKDTDDKGVTELIVAKHRGGPTGTARVGWVGSRTAFVNLEATDGTPTVTYARGARNRRGAAPAPHPALPAPIPANDGASVYDRVGEGLDLDAQVMPGELNFRGTDPDTDPFD